MPRDVPADVGFLDDMAAAVRDMIKETPCNVTLITGLKHGTPMHVPNLVTSLKILSRYKPGFAFAIIHEQPFPLPHYRGICQGGTNALQSTNSTAVEWRATNVCNDSH